MLFLNENAGSSQIKVPFEKNSYSSFSVGLFQIPSKRKQEKMFFLALYSN